MWCNMLLRQPYALFLKLKSNLCDLLTIPLHSCFPPLLAIHQMACCDDGTCIPMTFIEVVNIRVSKSKTTSHFCKRRRRLFIVSRSILQHLEDMRSVDFRLLTPFRR